MNGGDSFAGPTGHQSGNENVQHNYFAPPRPPEPVTWPVRVGSVPPLASAYQRRVGVRDRLNRARAGHGTVVLTQVLAGGGGVGKSQLAARCAHDALADGTDLVVWATAADTEQVVALYSRAAARVRAPGATGRDARADAEAFLAWLATTDRSWLVVLDDINDPHGMGPWWPPASAGGHGRVLATTRRRDAVLSGGGRAVVPVDLYTSEEADAFLRHRFTGADCALLLDSASETLAEALGRLPLALSHAAAYMINERVPCADYLALFTAQDVRLDTVLSQDNDTEGYGRQVAAALLLSLDAARRTEPVGLALPALRLAAVLDPAGHPRSLWDSPAVHSYLAASSGGTVGANEARAAVRVLHRFSLIDDNATAGPRAITLHALTARATRETTPDEDKPGIHRTTADALVHVWPDEDYLDPALAAVLRANTDVLAGYAGDGLWVPDGHVVLFRYGRSLDEAGLYAAAVTYWELRTAQAERLLGPNHVDTLTSRGNLASAYWLAERSEDAVSLAERVLADHERVLGRDHLRTLTARHNLASAYWQAGRVAEAVGIQEQVLADRERTLGPDHPRTLITRSNLATCYSQMERTDEAVRLQERVLTDFERVHGPRHPDTVFARHSLAFCYARAQRTGEAIRLTEQVLTEREQIIGRDHPDTLITRSNLAHLYWQEGRADEAVRLAENVAADCERVLGPDHPTTLLTHETVALWRSQPDSPTP